MKGSGEQRSIPHNLSLLRVVAVVAVLLLATGALAQRGVYFGDYDLSSGAGDEEVSVPTVESVRRPGKVKNTAGDDAAPTVEAVRRPVGEGYVYRGLEYAAGVLERQADEVGARWRESLVNALVSEGEADFADYLSGRGDAFWGELSGMPGRQGQVLIDSVMTMSERHLAGTAFWRTVDLDYTAGLGARPRGFAISAAGALRETADSVVAWGLRGYSGSGQEQSPGNSARLIYRRVVNIGGSDALLGGNVFLDYASHQSYGDFWRWSQGLEVKSGILDVNFNHYLAMTDGKAQSDGYIAYSRSGYDFGAQAQLRRYLSGGMTYYKFAGEYGDANDKGQRYHIHFRHEHLLRDTVPGELSFRLEYDRPDDGGRAWGGQFWYVWQIDRAVAARGRTVSEAFDARAHFFAPVMREDRQRIGISEKKIADSVLVVSKATKNVQSYSAGEVTFAGASVLVLPTGVVGDVFTAKATGGGSVYVYALVSVHPSVNVQNRYRVNSQSGVLSLDDAFLPADVDNPNVADRHTVYISATDGATSATLALSVFVHKFAATLISLHYVQVLAGETGAIWTAVFSGSDVNYLRNGGNIPKAVDIGQSDGVFNLSEAFGAEDVGLAYNIGFQVSVSGVVSDHNLVVEVISAFISHPIANAITITVGAVGAVWTAQAENGGSDLSYTYDVVGNYGQPPGAPLRYRFAGSVLYLDVPFDIDDAADHTVTVFATDGYGRATVRLPVSVVLTDLRFVDVGASELTITAGVPGALYTVRAAGGSSAYYDYFVESVSAVLPPPGQMDIRTGVYRLTDGSLFRNADVGTHTVVFVAQDTFAPNEVRLSVTIDVLENPLRFSDEAVSLYVGMSGVVWTAQPAGGDGINTYVLLSANPPSVAARYVLDSVSGELVLATAFTADDADHTLFVSATDGHSTVTAAVLMDVISGTLAVISPDEITVQVGEGGAFYTLFAVGGSGSYLYIQEAPPGHKPTPLEIRIDNTGLQPGETRVLSLTDGGAFGSGDIVLSAADREVRFRITDAGGGATQIRFTLTVNVRPMPLSWVPPAAQITVRAGQFSTGAGDAIFTAVVDSSYVGAGHSGLHISVISTNPPRWQMPVPGNRLVLGKYFEFSFNNTVYFGIRSTVRFSDDEVNVADGANDHTLYVQSTDGYTAATIAISVALQPNRVALTLPSVFEITANVSGAVLTLQAAGGEGVYDYAISAGSPATVTSRYEIVGNVLRITSAFSDAEANSDGAANHTLMIAAADDWSTVTVALPVEVRRSPVVLTTPTELTVSAGVAVPVWTATAAGGDGNYTYSLLVALPSLLTNRYTFAHNVLLLTSPFTDSETVAGADHTLWVAVADSFTESTVDFGVVVRPAPVRFAAARATVSPFITVGGAFYTARATSDGGGNNSLGLYSYSLISTHPPEVVEAIGYHIGAASGVVAVSSSFASRSIYAHTAYIEADSGYTKATLTLHVDVQRPLALTHTRVFETIIAGQMHPALFTAAAFVNAGTTPVSYEWIGAGRYGGQSDTVQAKYSFDTANGALAVVQTFDDSTDDNHRIFLRVSDSYVSVTMTLNVDVIDGVRFADGVSTAVNAVVDASDVPLLTLAVTNIGAGSPPPVVFAIDSVRSGAAVAAAYRIDSGGVVVANAVPATDHTLYFSATHGIFGFADPLSLTVTVDAYTPFRQRRTRVSKNLIAGQGELLLLTAADYVVPGNTAVSYAWAGAGRWGGASDTVRAKYTFNAANGRLAVVQNFADSTDDDHEIYIRVADSYVTATITLEVDVIDGIAFAAGAPGSISVVAGAGTHTPLLTLTVVTTGEGTYQSDNRITYTRSGSGAANYSIVTDTDNRGVIRIFIPSPVGTTHTLTIAANLNVISLTGADISSTPPHRLTITY